MKFDFAIGNPPYQEEIKNNGRKSPVYNYFMEEAYKVADIVELITPARFLFDAGQTPKLWNEKMLNDNHFKVLHYESDGSEIFPNTDIKGGVAITLRDEKRDFGRIEVFTAYDELNDILKKVKNKAENFICNIITGAVPYHFSDKLKNERPELIQIIGKSFDLRTNVLDKLDKEIFFEKNPNDGNRYVRIFGLKNRARIYEWINIDYIIGPSNFEYYKVFLPKAIGSGAFGETLSTPVIGEPEVGHTQSFVSIGAFETENEAMNLIKYLKTKFCRAMLGVLKITQDITPEKWKYVPSQDFTTTSDIDWTTSISNIDKQLYKKYGLSEIEIQFIETNVKEME